MNCNTARTQILLEQSGEISDRRRDALKRHLAHCSGCRIYAEDLEILTRAVRSDTGSLRISELTRHSIMQEAAAACKASRPVTRRNVRRPAILIPLAAAAVLLIAAGLQLFSSRQPASLPNMLSDAEDVTPYEWDDNLDEQLNRLEEAVATVNQSINYGADEIHSVPYSAETLARELLVMEES